MSTRQLEASFFFTGEHISNLPKVIILVKEVLRLFPSLPPIPS